MPAPGWYPDPWRLATARWWDGWAWSAAVLPAGPMPASGPASAGAGEPMAGIADPPRGRWGLGDVALMFAITAASVVAIVVVVVVLVAAAGPQGTSTSAPLGVDLGSVGNAWATIASLVLPWIGLAGWPLLVGRWKGPGWRASFGFAPRWSSLGWGLLGGAGTFVAILIGSLLVAVAVGSQADSAAADAAVSLRSVPVAFAVMLALISLGAPFVEELAFRGLFWGAMVKRWGRPWLATFVTGAAFGVFHLEPVRLVGLVAGGIVLGIVRHKAGLAASVVSHATLNTVAALSLLLS